MRGGRPARNLRHPILPRGEDIKNLKNDYLPGVGGWEGFPSIGFSPSGYNPASIIAMNGFTKLPRRMESLNERR
jgi:hypothetical protein